MEPAPPIRLLFVEDHEMVATSLAAILGDQPDIEVVGRAGNVQEAVALATRQQPDVVVMDYRLPDGDGIEAARLVLPASPTSNIVMLTASDAMSLVFDALDAGCCGFVNKQSDIEELLAAVRAAAIGEAHFSPGVLERLVRSRRTTTGKQVAALSQREIEVLQLVADGLATGEIAERLFLSHHTVRNHVRNILGKLGAHSKVEAVVIASRSGYISLQDEPGL